MSTTLLYDNTEKTLSEGTILTSISENVTDIIQSFTTRHTEAISEAISNTTAFVKEDLSTLASHVTTAIMTSVEEVSVYSTCNGAQMKKMQCLADRGVCQVYRGDNEVCLCGVGPDGPYIGKRCETSDPFATADTMITVVSVLALFCLLLMVMMALVSYRYRKLQKRLTSATSGLPNHMENMAYAPEDKIEVVTPTQTDDSASGLDNVFMES